MTEDTVDRRFQALLDYLKRRRGFDFSAYKQAGLMRRIRGRMSELQVSDFGEYIGRLQSQPEEFKPLFDAILNNTTSFFRDPEAWVYLSREVITRMVANKAASDPVRIWSAGCSTGEEAYSLAMVMAEEMGMEEFGQRVKIYATDLDEAALAYARRAIYAPDEIEQVPDELRDRYFEPAGDQFAIRSELRRSVVFGKHDISQDAPISKLDLLACRNLLMYFSAEVQTRILSRMAFSLEPQAFLFLGRVEMLMDHTGLLTPADLEHRVFIKLPTVGRRHRLLTQESAEEDEASRFGLSLRSREASFNTSPLAQLVVDAKGKIALLNERSQSMFGLGAEHLGRYFNDLEISYQPLDLRLLIEESYSQQRSVARSDVERIIGEDETQYLDVQVVPLAASSGNPLGVLIAFEDVTRHHKLRVELARANQNLAQTSEQLRAANEDLETTNEQLHTINAELRATNEELHSMNVELRSLNVEMQTTNTELQQRTDQLDRSNAFLASILAGLRAAVVVVDNELKILIWNREAERLWGLRAEEVLGRTLTGLGPRIHFGSLEAPLISFLAGREQVRQLSIEAPNGSTPASRYAVTLTPLSGLSVEREGVVILVDRTGG